MSTECSYDQLFVYDGQAYSSPMLGSFSGDSVPDIVTAASGYVSTDSRYYSYNKNAEVSINKVDGDFN